MEPQRIQLVPAGSSCPQTPLVACLRAHWIPHTEDGAVALPCTRSLSIRRPHPVPSGSRSQPWPPLGSSQGPPVHPCVPICFRCLARMVLSVKAYWTMRFQNRSDGACRVHLRPIVVRSPPRWPYVSLRRALWPSFSSWYLFCPAHGSPWALLLFKGRMLYFPQNAIPG